MSVFAAVMTGPGAGAIATIQVFGDSAQTVVRTIFRRTEGKSCELTNGRILLGRIVDGEESIDQVTIGCEGPGSFAIHCHGNPLIVERIMRLLRRHGVAPVSAEQMLARMLMSRGREDSIGVEAKLALATVKTIEGAAILSNQVKAGLSWKVRQWREQLDSLSLDQIVAEAGQVLRDSEPAQLIVSGCTIALIGPPSTGKSTLLNALAGREKAIVTGIRGTTRDWVSAEIHIPPLAVTLIDTAGLDSELAAGDIDRTAQRKSIEILERADLILLVLDLSRPSEQLGDDLMHVLAGRRVVTVLNKADLPRQINSERLPEQLGPRVPVSAKLGTGIEDLIRAVHRACDVAEFPSDRVVAFTERQSRLLDALQHAGSKSKVAIIVTELLEGQIPV